MARIKQSKRKRQRKKRRGGKRNKCRRGREKDSQQQTVLTDDKTIINLTDVILEEEDVKNLSLGLSFCQPDGFNYEQSRIDLFLFTRKLKLSKMHAISKRKTKRPSERPEFEQDEIDKWKGNLLIEDIHLMRQLWSLEDNSIEEIGEEQLVARLESEGIRLDKEGASGFKSKSRTVPAPSGDMIDQFSDTVTKELKALRLKMMSKTSRNKNTYYKTLKKLSNNPRIIIRSSDKGGNVVIWSIEDYMEEAYKQLNDAICYRRIDMKHVDEVKVNFDNKLEQWRKEGFINDHEHRFLKVDFPKLPVFYLIPKIHKDALKPPGRPIVSIRGSLFEYVSQYIDSFLQPLVMNLASYLKDSTDFLRRIFDITWESEFLLISLDVVSLYTSIPHNL
ncbi:hypothetical protein NDU88_002433, partial [Pleurodeles waltl]